MNDGEWAKVMDYIHKNGDAHVFFRTSSGPSSLENEWKERFPDCRVLNNWYPYVRYGVIDVDCDGFKVAGIWLLDEEDALIRIKSADDQAAEIIRSLGSSNIESGVLRLFSYEMTPEG